MMQLGSAIEPVLLSLTLIVRINHLREGRFALEREGMKTREGNKTLQELTDTKYKSKAKRLEQVIFDLLGNALKFTKEGHIFICAKLIETQQTRIEVTDYGIAMNEQQISQLFKPFSQADKSTTRKFGAPNLDCQSAKPG